MKWTTANAKNPNYTEKHLIYVGTHTGSFKKLTACSQENPFGQTNLRSLESLDKTNRVTALAFGDEQRSEILLGQSSNEVQFYNPADDSLQRRVKFQHEPVVGLAHYENHLVAGFSNGQIQVLNLAADEGDEAEPVLISAGVSMDRLRQCPSQRNLIATGGKDLENRLKIFDIETNKQTFNAKNLPNDWLQLEVKVWDSDVGFIDEPHMLSTCSRHGYVRVYDTRKQRRPVQCFASEEPQMSFTSLIAHGNYIYTGTTMGVMKAFDIRRMKTFVHTYKGFTGSVSDLHLDETGKYLASAALDRYVRVHHVDSCVMLYQSYVKSKATRILIRESFEKSSEKEGKEREMDDNDDDDEENGKKKATDDGAVSADEEYDEIFENMQTIRENVNSDQEAEEDDDETAESTPAQAGSKRKSKAKVSKKAKRKLT